MKNRITNRCNQFDLLAMRKQVVMWQLIDDPKQNVWRQFERCECQTHTEDRSMSIPHQSIADLSLNSIHCFVALFDSFFRLINRKANTMRNQNLMTIFDTDFKACAASICNITTLLQWSTRLPALSTIVVSAFNANNNRTASMHWRDGEIDAVINEVWPLTLIASISAPKQHNDSMISTRPKCVACVSGT